MAFSMIDRIVGMEAGKSLEAVKTLSMCEEYLADHFPGFPVMPGVLMLEAMVQAASWLLRLSGSDSGSLFLLSSVKAIRYGSFVKPGDVLRVAVELVSKVGTGYTFRGRGAVQGRRAVAGRFVLQPKKLSSIDPSLRPTEEKIRNFYEEQSLALKEFRRSL